LVFHFKGKNTGWGAELKKIVWPMKEEAAADWRKLHNEELYSFYFSPNIRFITENRMI